MQSLSDAIASERHHTRLAMNATVSVEFSVVLLVGSASARMASAVRLRSTQPCETLIMLSHSRATLKELAENWNERAGVKTEKHSGVEGSSADRTPHDASTMISAAFMSLLCRKRLMVESSRTTQYSRHFFLSRRFKKPCLVPLNLRETYLRKMYSSFCNLWRATSQSTHQRTSEARCGDILGRSRCCLCISRNKQLPVRIGLFVSHVRQELHDRHHRHQQTTAITITTCQHIVVASQ
jgi:hypothetical protein